MAILTFQKPEKVIVNAATETEGQFEFRPLEPGFGLTIGNALRRVLLSSLEGYAFTSVRISGVDHEFSTLKGVVEDVTEIVLNLKQVRLKRQIDASEGETVKVSISGQEQFTAGDLGKFTAAFQVLNPELIICRMESSVKIEMELTIEKGRGYVGAEENKRLEAIKGTIALDSIYTPIKNVKYSVENYRVEQKTDFEKLVFDVQTDGSIHPQHAVTEAANILIEHFSLFTDERIKSEEKVVVETESFDEEILHMRQLLKTKLTDLDLSVRALNCLKAAEVETLADLVTYTKQDLMKFRNFGKKSLTELDELAETKGLVFGMDVTKYKLEKE
ncbi:MAG: DNA-directed RNA polymerase subunit alpha [Schleiferiaceae bacterium]|jgi:DNA-directed RNA polymerase subunit alpha|nr:DNA-directed RNA polymerase subunit alpha [Schleiferiaceae bacterium]MDP4627998.1 DNA-directed RNA polymerase subunit alpha [Schleiferiaceae bacterium]MDP4728476.1 DNA-directed RNA polymerase subunit alpha [Schleiferiaceae bacterium]MDP4750038.1 DNA-directed RNA polymerase subunit alpha [Schleiferiaceae bacterium]MDP4859496.1 DNA-directed RNA polymerase subunit alpha [Schleiferiaceae bacterium]